MADADRGRLRETFDAAAKRYDLEGADAAMAVEAGTARHCRGRL